MTGVVFSDVPVTSCLPLCHTLALYIPFVSPLSHQEEEMGGIETGKLGEAAISISTLGFTRKRARCSPLINTQGYQTRCKILPRAKP